ncbi:MAG: NAD(P)/FAD-dependent oxidoreductase [Bacteroidota bacterium]
MFQVVIVGGGLAGLVSATLLSRAGVRVAVLEKNTYPFHRVCGEYISNETLPFLRSLGLDPFALGAVNISQFRITSPKGTALSMPLDLGGFGISRYTLDQALANLALEAGAEVRTGVRVLHVARHGDRFQVELPGKNGLEAPVVIGSFGKRSNLDKALDRQSFHQRSPYIGVKHHLRIEHPESLIELHNFKDGYCGISRVEDGRTCLCYLTTRDNLRIAGSIEQLEANVLSRNPHLRTIFQQGEKLYDRPKVINEIGFSAKPLIESGVFTCGDAAGMIAPLCGNGMAMAIHGAKLLAELLIRHLQGDLNRADLERAYRTQWTQLFGMRLRIGRTVQRFFGNPTVTEGFVRTFRAAPPLARMVVKNTHGQPF